MDGIIELLDHVHVIPLGLTHIKAHPIKISQQQDVSRHGIVFRDV